MYKHSTHIHRHSTFTHSTHMYTWTHHMQSLHINMYRQHTHIHSLHVCTQSTCMQNPHVHTYTHMYNRWKHRKAACVCMRRAQGLGMRPFSPYSSCREQSKPGGCSGSACGQEASTSREHCFQAGERKASSAEEDEVTERMLPVLVPGCPPRR